MGGPPPFDGVNMKVICPTDIRVATLHGAVKLFQANVETEVSEDIGYAALQMGAKLVDDATSLIEDIVVKEVGVEEVVEDKLDQLIAQDKHERLVAVMREIYLDGNPGDFKLSDNTPKAAVITRRFGETVPVDEREKAWAEVTRS